MKKFMLWTVLLGILLCMASCSQGGEKGTKSICWTRHRKTTAQRILTSIRKCRNFIRSTMRNRQPVPGAERGGGK